MMKKLFLSVLAKAFGWLFVVLLVAGCGKKNNESYSNPTKLIYGIVPSEDAEHTLKRMNAITGYFSKKLNMEVECIQISNYSALIEAMRAKKVHMGGGGAFVYILAAEKANAEAIITTQVTSGDPRFNESCFITYPGSGINNVEDVIAHAKDINLVWAYPTSATGHLIPRYYLQQRGVMPEDFKEVFTSTDHAATILTIASHKADVAAIFYPTLDMFLRTKKIKEGDVKIIWMSEPVASAPVFVRKDLDAGLKMRIQQAYLTLKKDSPETYAAVRSQYKYDVNYIVAHDSLYKPIRDMANKIEGLEIKAD